MAYLMLTLQIGLIPFNLDKIQYTVLKNLATYTQTTYNQSFEIHKQVI